MVLIPLNLIGSGDIVTQEVASDTKISVEAGFNQDEL